MKIRWGMSEVEILEKLAVRLGLRIVRHRKFAIPMIVMAGILLTVILIVGSYKMAAVHADAEIDFWKSVATEAEPEVCSLCEYGEATLRAAARFFVGTVSTL